MLDIVLSARGRWVEGDGPLWPVTESVGVWEAWEPISPWSYVGDVLLAVDSMLRWVLALLAFECLVRELLASREKDGLRVGFILGALLICASSLRSLLLRGSRFLNRFRMLARSDMVALCYFLSCSSFCIED